MNDTAIQAWEMAAGVSVGSTSVAIRTVLMVVVLIWAGWFVYVELHHFRHQDVDLYDVLRKNLRVLWVVSITVVLIFVS